MNKEESKEESIAKPKPKSKRRHRTQSRTSKSRLLAMDRERKALELRLSGESFVSISEKLGYADRSGAFRACDAALRMVNLESKNSLERTRSLNLERLNALRRKIVWPDVVDKTAPSHTRYSAVSAELNIQNRESALLGLDAPRQLATTNRNLNFNVEISYEEPRISDDEAPNEIPEIPIIEHSNEG